MVHFFCKIRSAAFAISVIIILTLATSCKKMLQINLPADKITGETVYSNTNTTVAVLNGLYAKLVDYLGSTSVRLAGVADDINAAPFLRTPFYKNAFDVNDSGQSDQFWSFSYGSGIYTCNSVIEGVTASKNIPDASKSKLLAEARFARALMYFYLVNLYGDVPLVTTTSLVTNSNIARSPVNTVYKQVIEDLTFAKENLPSNFVGTDLSTVTAERVRPTTWAASSLLARVYLYKSEWKNAELESSAVIQNSSLFDTVAVNDVFEKNSKETIWALQPNNNQTPGETTSTYEGKAFLPLPGTNISGSQASTNLLTSFEQGDLRKQNWIKFFVDNSQSPAITYSFFYKYKNGSNDSQTSQPQTEYSIVFRIAEQYLIRSEARARQHDLIGAKSDLDIIRRRAGLSGITISDDNTMLSNIMHERQVELFTENGHRWLDLKRTGKVDEVMSIQTKLKDGQWQPFAALFAIPLLEFTLNPALKGHQNPGYPEHI
ncbi:RagB/SusD family nutrient uptake outer membrane protein [Mucilaginibacter litoreus]|uniref:RagB/SusD family nutrient uptake outer membrane protein n=1 Tax=Mucilaginibacter litoreus TaxID=1048221 RepID=A0ABW3AMH9_9SPHI